MSSEPPEDSPVQLGGHGNAGADPVDAPVGDSGPSKNVDHTHAALAIHYPAALARLLRRAGSLHAAEDAVQEAVARALERWHVDGIPEHPAAWLTRVALNHHRDGLRADARRERHSPALEQWTANRAPPRQPPWDDAMLQLICTCCAPELKLDQQVALTLHTVCGLGTRAVAAALLTSPQTMERRISRAKQRLRESGQELERSPEAHLDARLPGVLAVVHLLFNEGYWASAQGAPIRLDLTDLALSLAASLHGLRPEHAEVAGLLSLLLLHRARQAARFARDGQPLTLRQQDRSRWDSPTIDEACALLREALDRGPHGPLQIEAAIAAVHCSAAHADDTDWLQIASLYEALEARRASPLVRVQRALAVGMALTPAEGLALLETVADAPALRDSPYGHLVEAELCERDGQLARAQAALERALERARNETERSQVRASLQRVQDQRAP